MSEKYTPTTDEVRNHYDPSCEPRFQDDDRLEEHIPAEFDRWLAAHDRRVADVAAQNAALRIALGEAMMR